MKTSILICATCFIVTGCSAQLRFPSLSSALSSLTGFGGGSSSSSNGQSGSQQAQSSSPYGGLVRDYGRNLMMAMSNIYPTLFKPPQSQQQQPQQSQPSSQSAYDQAFGASQYGSQGLFSSQSAPSFTFGGSTFSISPSLPFGSLSGASSQSQPSGNGGQASGHSPFSASFGSSINSPSSFGPLSSSQFLQNSMPSFAPASSYNAAFEAANGGPGSFGGLSSAPSGMQASSGSPLNNQAALLSQPSNSQPMNSFSQMPSFAGQHEPIVGAQQVHQPQQAALNQQQASLAAASQSSSQFSQHGAQPGNQYASQQYRPEMMSIAASAPVPSSNSYSAPPTNFGSIHGSQSQQVPASPSSYQQPSYR